MFDFMVEMMDVNLNVLGSMTLENLAAHNLLFSTRQINVGFIHYFSEARFAVLSN